MKKGGTTRTAASHSSGAMGVRIQFLGERLPNFG
jgi:hypothetical protein